MQGQVVIKVEGLRKCYSPVMAVDGISFQVQAGEIFGMVGPNGSGKTTTIECIEGLRIPDDGSIRLLDLDPMKHIYELRERIGVQLQSSSLPNRIRVEEALDLFSSFYQHTRDWHILLDELGLAEKRRSIYSQLSGGQKQRLFLALALINCPEIVFLDELTTGLDPQARHATWDLVREIRSQGTTVFLTTHFMDEAEQLCDRVAVLDQGCILALDTPDQLIQQTGIPIRISFQLNSAARSFARKQGGALVTTFHPARMRRIAGLHRVEQEGDQVTVFGQGEDFIADIVIALKEDGVSFSSLRTDQASLEDVFLAITGRAIRN